MPPDRSTTAGLLALASRFVVPEEFVQLHLVAHRKRLSHDPVSEFACVDLAETGREQDVATLVYGVFRDHVACPLEVGTIADDEFHLVVWRQQREVVPVV